MTSGADATVHDEHGSLALSPELIAELQAVVGMDSVLTEPAEVNRFKDDYALDDDDRHLASAVVQPSTTEQVQEIMRIASRRRIPVWPHSQGRNLGHGGASPLVRGSIQLGFQKMARVLEINEELAYAVVEAGVTWFDLHRAIVEGGHDLMAPCPDLGWGSVIGNSMDSGHTYQHYGADYMMPTGFEVVLPDGDLMRTGHGAIPGGAAWHVYKRSLGPSVDAMFVQSNLGIVTRMGVWLKRSPEAYAPVLLSIDEDDDLEAAVDALRELRLAGHLEGVPALFSTLRASHMLRDAPIAASTRLAVADLREIAERTGLGAWAVRAAAWGDREVVEAKLSRIREVWASIPSGRSSAERLYARDEYDQLVYSADQIMAGIPTLKAIEGNPPNFAHINVAAVVPLQGRQVRSVIECIRALFEAAELNFGASVMITGERSCAVIIGIRYARDDADATHRAFDLARQITLSTGELGYGEPRPHLDFMELAADQYSFNGHAYRRLIEKIKDAVDPAGVLAPGRHGIWPMSYRVGGERP